MTYTAFDYSVFPIFVLYLVLSVFGTYVTIKMYMKWRERQVRSPLYLTLVFVFLTLALIVLAIGLAEAIITGYYKEVYRFSLPFAYSMVILADIFLYIFVDEITDRGRKGFIPFIIIGIVIIILLFLPWNWWGVPPEDYEGKLNIRLYSTFAVVLYSYVIYITLALVCYKTRQKADEQVTRFGLLLLFFAMIAFMMFFLMFIGDTLMIVLYDHPGYSVFVYIAWIFAVIFIILTYLSLVMPNWLVKWIKKEE